MIVNRYTGLRIEGFDPVGLFYRCPRRAWPARISRLRRRGGLRFRNEGNRASFVAHPEIYGPQFGGYDPIDVARGVAFAGNPRFWLVVRQRLYLFGREQNRDAFAADPARKLREAKTRWPALEQDLANANSCAAAGSPQAMNSGTIKPSRPLPNCKAAPFQSVILPPAAVTIACPAATSHSLVGREAGIDIGAAFRHPAQFHRRSQHLANRA